MASKYSFELCQLKSQNYIDKWRKSSHRFLTLPPETDISNKLETSKKNKE